MVQKTEFWKGSRLLITGQDADPHQLSQEITDTCTFLEANHCTMRWRLQNTPPFYVPQRPTSRVFKEDFANYFDLLSHTEHSTRLTADTQWNFVELNWNFPQLPALCNWWPHQHPIPFHGTSCYKDWVSWIVHILTFKGRYKSNLISFQGNKFYEMSLPSAFYAINQTPIGSFMPTGWDPYSLAKYAFPSIWPQAKKKKKPYGPSIIDC